MTEINESTPLALLTVGQLLELIEKTTPKEDQVPKEEPKEDRVGIEEILEMTGLSKSAIYKMTMLNDIPHRKFGNRLIFSRTAIKDWMESQTKTKVTRQQKAARRLADLAAKRNKSQS
jgi:excisionase family DNA binding protein